jgi:hypothetical protein
MVLILTALHVFCLHNMSKNQALPVDALQAFEKSLAMALSKKKASSGAKPTYLYGILLHNQDSLQSVLADIKESLPASNNSQ